MKRVVAFLFILVLAAGAAAAGPYWEIEQAISPPAVLGDCYAIVGYNFSELVGYGPLRVSGDLYYEDLSLWRWTGAWKASAFGLNLALSANGWTFEMDGVATTRTWLAAWFLDPTDFDGSLTLSKRLDDFLLYIRWSSDYGFYATPPWTHTPSFGLRYEWTSKLSE